MNAFSLKACSYCGSPTDQAEYCCAGCEALNQGFIRRTVSLADFAFLDQPNFKKLYHTNSEDFDYQLFVEGIHCSSCVHLIEKLPKYDPSIQAARVDFVHSKLLLKVSHHFSLAKVIQQLSAMGYKAHFLKPYDETNLKQQKENKILLKKMAVAGACAGNIMLFVIPVYAGLDGVLRTIFNWASLLLFLPILFFSGTIFYRNALAGLRLRVFNIDLPISIALLSGFSLSTINLVKGNGAIYYDSTASFIFLILCSRYILKRIQQKLISSYQFEDELASERYTRIIGTDEEFISVDEIRKNDLIKLTSGQILPADGLIESEDALADISVLNGEPLPRKFEKGLTILAGSKMISQNIIVKVSAEPKDTHLATVMNQLRAGIWRKSKFITLTDHCAQFLILSVLTLAVVTFLVLLDHDPQEAFNRALALIVLACPCALALGSPLAIALAVKKAQAKGILIKNTDALEKILKLKNIFFDKTGTLTEPDLKLISSNPPIIADKIKTVLISLEQKSFHPIAFALRKIFHDTRALPVLDHQEISGRGVMGRINSHFYEFGQDRVAVEQSALTLVLKEDGQTLCTLSFENSIRPESKDTVKALKNKGMNCVILSGDSQKRVFEIGAKCDLAIDCAKGNLSAEQKNQFIQMYENTCMIGDGTNDALALQSADVGIAIKGSTPINLQAADILFTRSGLSSLIELFDVAKKAKKVLIRNLAFSLFYNIVGGSLAIMGFISPLVAAILMPVSSLIIILSTLWGLR